MTNSQLSQNSFKTCLRKLTIIAPFIHRNNLLFYFKTNKKNWKRQKKTKKIGQPFFLFYFSKLPQKR